MVVLTIVTEKNGETIYCEGRIPKVHFMKLISCSLYNSWDTLKKEGSANVELKENVKSVSKLLPGHYTWQKNSLFDRNHYKQLETEIHQPLGQLVIKKLEGKPIELDNDLANFLGIRRKLQIITFAPTTYFIHCDLIEKEQNLFNGKRKDLLAMFDVKGKAFEKVSYHSSPQQVLRDFSTDQFINSITLSVKDEHGELFDFEGMPMEFELELN